MAKAEMKKVRSSLNRDLDLSLSRSAILRECYAGVLFCCVTHEPSRVCRQQLADLIFN